MGFLAAFFSIVSALKNAFRRRHAWRYDALRGVRTCACCGRQEEMVVDLVASYWMVLEHGDETAHAPHAAAMPPGPDIDATLATARAEATPF